MLEGAGPDQPGPPPPGAVLVAVEATARTRQAQPGRTLADMAPKITEDFDAA